VRLGDVVRKDLESAEAASLERFRAYQRRWNTGKSFECDITIGLVTSYLRRQKVIEWRRLLERVPLELLRGGRAS
jgi:hypothetical protein